MEKKVNVNCMLKNLLLFFIIVILCTACKKEPTRPYKKIEYQVVVYPGNEVGITYNSDYTISTGQQKEIIINDANNVYTNYTWIAKHLQQKDEPYYIKVKYKTYNNPDSLKYGVFVFINDTVVAKYIDSVYTPEVVLTGKVYSEQ